MPGVFCSGCSSQKGPGRASALGTLGRRLLTGLGPPVSAHVPVLVHVGLHQVAHLHGVDLPTLAVADLGEGGTVTRTSLHTHMVRDRGDGALGTTVRDGRQPDMRLPALPTSRAAEGPTEISWHVHLSGSHFLPVS